MSHNPTILIADDHRIFAEGLESVLRIKIPHASFEIVNSGEAAWERIETRPDFHLVITDISMQGMTGIDLATRIKLKYPFIKVLVLSMHNERQIVMATLATEAEGFILKTSTAQEIVNAIEDILQDGTHYSREVMRVMLTTLKEEKQVKFQNTLTSRELEILKLVIEENSTEFISQKLFISKRTVETHRMNIMEKTNCKNLIALYKFAIQNGLVNP